jgi:succinyl-diaminopimelate desuccinylase
MQNHAHGNTTIQASIMTDTLSSEALALAQGLIRCPSVTPDAAQALDLAARTLQAAGFICHPLTFSQDGTPDVPNLFARAGHGHPHLCLAGHLDVVPPGDETAWTHAPFAGDLAGDMLWGRGAVDMKGGVACMIAAALGYMRDHGGLPRGSISFLLTGDEEGPAINGTRKVLDWMSAHGERPDHCVLGEPTNPEAIGEMIKIGRRGSLNARLMIAGTQGHVAYPDLANNPMRGLAAVLMRLAELRLDEGTEHFAPSNLEITAIDTGNKAENVIPANVRVRFNIRYNNQHSAVTLEQRLHREIGDALASSGLSYELDVRSSGDSFLTEPGPWVQHLVGAIRDVTGRTPRFDTGGGISDARFIKDYCPVVEFGLTFGHIHKIDERVAVADLARLTAVYRNFLERYFAT